MRSDEPVRDATALWHITTPQRPRRVPGVAMAGFRERHAGPVDLPVIPYPAVTLLVDVGKGDDLAVVDDAHGRRARGNVVAGLLPGSIRGVGRDVECLQVRLSPPVAHAVLRDTSQLTGAVVSLDDLWGREATRVHEQLQSARTWEERFALVEDALARRLEPGREVDPEVGFAWRRIVARRGQVRVDQLAAEVDWSRKRLWSRFRSQVGLTPKEAARLVRFDDAAHRLAAGHPAARVAAEAGYADQSHLHREIAAFTSMTPTAVAAAPWLAVDDVAWGVSVEG